MGYLLAGETLIRTLTNIEEVVTLAQAYIGWAIAIPPIAAVAFMLDGAFIGATASRPMRNTMILSTFGIYLPAFYLLQNWGNHGLWAAMLIFMLASSHLFRDISSQILKNRLISW